MALFLKENEPDINYSIAVERNPERYPLLNANQIAM